MRKLRVTRLVVLLFLLLISAALLSYWRSNAASHVGTDDSAKGAAAQQAAVIPAAMPKLLSRALGDPPAALEDQPLIATGQRPAAPVPHRPPTAALITVGVADRDDQALVSGAADAVEPLAPVYIANLDTGVITGTVSLDDGSFQVSVFAPAGSWLQIKHGSSQLRDPILTEETVAWLNGLPGTIIRAPMPDPAPGSGIPFALVGTIPEGAGDWMLRGRVTTQTTALGVRFTMSGTLRIATPMITASTTISAHQVSGVIALRRFFDVEGRRVPSGGVFASTFKTPTGLPISREPAEQSPILVEVPIDGWTYAGGHSMSVPISTTLVIPSTTEAGLYRPHISLSFKQIPLGAGEQTARLGVNFGHYLPMLRLGAPQPPHLIWMLLINTLSNATRGTVAREDKDDLGLSPHIVTQADVFIVPRVDPRTGDPIAYRLEPFLPLVSMADRSLPCPPLIPFELPGGSLQVRVRRPDGTLDVLGPAPFQQSASQSPVDRQGKVLDDGGGRIDDVYQLTTLQPGFAYAFQDYGHHVITLTGVLTNVWGTVYQDERTHDVYVARELKLDPGQLPATPYEVGDVFSPGVQVYPPVPADVTQRLVLLPNSDPVQFREHLVLGRANRYGYFQPSSNSSYTMTAPGEYRVDVVATYLDQAETLWMGSATWGNVVEKPDTPLVAHGRRGRDMLGPYNLQWFFHRDLPQFPGLHTMYPYWSGDILWGNQTDTENGGEAIIPAITVQDTVGQIQSIIEVRWNSKAHSNLSEGLDFAGRLTNSELPLFSTTSDGHDLFWSPNLIDQYGYAYRTSERPGVRVHETIAEDSLGTSYWRFNAEFGGQAGFEGDLPNDLKWEFGGAVFRVLSETKPINEYAIYGSLWVLLPDNDPIGSRVTPPFQGATGAVDGGPIMTLKGQPIDLFFVPKGVQPGDVLLTDDVFSFSGHVGPPLDSRLSVTITAPSGVQRTIEGRASKIGWFYDPSTDFVVAEPGVWKVDVYVVHDRSISSGGTPLINNTGGVLGSSDGSYRFYVVEPDSPPLGVISPQPGFLGWPVDNATGIPITVTKIPVVGWIPPGLANGVISYTVRMPGFILDAGTVTPTGNTFTLYYDPLALNQDYPNLDLKTADASWPGLADPVLITFLLSGELDGERTHRAGAVFLDGDEAHPLTQEQLHLLFLPLVMRNQQR